MPLSPRRSPRTVNGVTNRPSTSSATPGLQRQPNGQTRGPRSPASRHEHRRISLSPSPPLTPSPPRTAHRSPPLPYRTPPPGPVTGAAELRGGALLRHWRDEPDGGADDTKVYWTRSPRPQMEDLLPAARTSSSPTRTASPPFGASVVGRPPRTPGGTPWELLSPRDASPELASPRRPVGKPWEGEEVSDCLRPPAGSSFYGSEAEWVASAAARSSSPTQAALAARERARGAAVAERLAGSAARVRHLVDERQRQRDALTTARLSVRSEHRRAAAAAALDGTAGKHGVDGRHPASGGGGGGGSGTPPPPPPSLSPPLHASADHVDSQPPSALAWAASHWATMHHPTHADPPPLSPPKVTRRREFPERERPWEHGGRALGVTRSGVRWGGNRAATPSV